MARTLKARLTLLAASMTAAFAGQTLAAPTVAGQQDALLRLKNATANAAQVAIHPATGAARFVRIGKTSASLKASGSTAVANPAARQAAAQQFMTEYGALFGVTNPASELTAAQVVTDKLGHSRVMQRQLYKGVPVFGGELRSHFDAQGNLKVVNGTFVPGIALDVTPKRSALQATAAAMARVKSGLKQATALTASTPMLLVYRDGLVRGVEGANRLVWQVTVGNGNNVREFVFVDAHSGKVVEQFTGIHDAKNRRAFDGAASATAPGPNYPNNPLWTEGMPLPTGVTEADNMIVASGEVHDLFTRAFGRDSFDGSGATMDSIFNRGWGCVNASWNGAYISFCPGTTTDDVTAHEWSHAYTQYTHGLIYAWQPGALNEAYSDIWGETIDRINGRDGSGGTADAPRTPGACSVSTTMPPALLVNSPSTLTSPPIVGGAGWGPQAFSVTANVTAVSPVRACSAIAENLTGKIALIERGDCPFTQKTLNAQAAGAAGVVVYDNVPGSPAGLGGTDPTNAITIPAVRVTQVEGQAILGALASGTVNITISSGPGTDPSVRWLIGEDSSAFGGAIRDMSSPNCYGQPAKVSDKQYFCSAVADNTTDQGGVHYNSGVPNHAYALLVDGGSYNGHTINAIGLTKAAHIYWRAQSVYQGPTSDFAAHADALEQSCADLTGASLNGLTTGTPTGDVINAGDCAQVAKAMTAVEMRLPPAQCNFQPILAKNPPALCTGGVPASVIADTFDGGRRGGLKWQVSNVGNVSGEFYRRDWAVTNQLPPGRTGYAMYGMDPNFSCAGPDQAGALRLDSPVFTVPVGANDLKMSFDHWMSSEGGYDGGNLKISVNGGPWMLVQASDFIYNAYNGTLLTAAGGNNNPMAGQPAFMGTDAGSLSGSWGRSIVNLAPYAAPGAKVQLRFEMGTDYCSGTTGWFVDDVNVYRCKAP